MENRETNISFKFRLGLVILAWLAVILAVAAINPHYLAYAPFFPVGLLTFLPKGNLIAIVVAWFFGPIVAFFGWVLYCWLCVTITRAQKFGKFFLIYSIFCGLLLLNVVGCKETIQAAAGIQ